MKIKDILIHWIFSFKTKCNYVHHFYVNLSLRTYFWNVQCWLFVDVLNTMVVTLKAFLLFLKTLEIHCFFLFYWANENHAFHTTEFVLTTQLHEMSYKENRPKNKERFKEISTRNCVATLIQLIMCLALTWWRYLTLLLKD